VVPFGEPARVFDFRPAFVGAELRRAGMEVGRVDVRIYSHTFISAFSFS
jgi:hypothetical protein